MMSLTVRVDELESRMKLVQTEIGNVQSEIGSMKEDMQKMMKLFELFVRNVGNDREINRFTAIKERKLDLPSFDGKDPEDWIFRAEHHFDLNRLTNEERIEAAVVAFEGDAIRWFQWESKRSPMIQWEDMKLKLLKHFGITGSGSLFEQFLEVKQEGNVADYRRKFVNLAAPLDDISEEMFLGQFMSGLQPMIKAELRLFSPENVSDAMDIASRIEEKNKSLVSAGNWFHDEEEVDQGVLAYLRFPPNFNNDEGIHINELEQRLKVSHDKIMESLRRLEVSDNVYYHTRNEPLAEGFKRIGNGVDCFEFIDKGYSDENGLRMNVHIDHGNELVLDWADIEVVEDDEGHDSEQDPDDDNDSQLFDDIPYEHEADDEIPSLDKTSCDEFFHRVSGI
ncbi:unnamed protein product [Lactuca virosa]|uniref:Retrotransposon gag domain-containing protein n=1 Tax=Lactuca virosa TaxID=75947 RepID=A0AAU9NSJ2_9ASTR|nr:unnamed protein product [Lactuca virosa]